jgi:hypothetical protein
MSVCFFFKRRGLADARLEGQRLQTTNGHQRRNFFSFFSSTGEHVGRRCTALSVLQDSIILKSSLVLAMAGIWIGACLGSPRLASVQKRLCVIEEEEEEEEKN